MTKPRRAAVPLLFVLTLSGFAPRRVDFRGAEPPPRSDSWLCKHVSPFFCPIWPGLGPAPTPTPIPAPRSKKGT